MNIHKATLSSWKLRKNRIPLPLLAKICNELGIDPLLINDNIHQTDRQIVEIN